MALPRFIVLQSDFNQKYLQYVKEDTEFYRFLQGNGDSVTSPDAKFEVEKAKTGHGLVHIRCCYNNKYWVPQSSTSSWIVAGADKAEEDQSKWSCTLFEPVTVDSNTIRLRHVQLSCYVGLWQYSHAYSDYLAAIFSDPDPAKRDIFKFVDWESLVIMPKYVAFKGDNDLYLRVMRNEGGLYLAFDSTNIQDYNVENKVYATTDGNVRIKSSVVSKFWRHDLDSGLIRPDSDNTTTDDLYTKFRPVKKTENTISLITLDSDYYCAREKNGKCLCAIDSMAKIEVCELVTSRKIDNVKFRLCDSWIHSEGKISLATGEVINDTDKRRTMEVKLSYTDIKKSTWYSSFSLKLGVAMTIKTGVPFVKAGQAKILEKYEGEFEWGQTRTTTEEVVEQYKVEVKPRSKVKVTLSATKVDCLVPFSYTQTDTRTNGEVISYNNDDGFYTGINYFDFKHETKEEHV